MFVHTKRCARELRHADDDDDGYMAVFFFSRRGLAHYLMGFIDIDFGRSPARLGYTAMRIFYLCVYMFVSCLYIYCLFWGVYAYLGVARDIQTVVCICASIWLGRV